MHDAAIGRRRASGVPRRRENVRRDSKYGSCHMSVSFTGSPAESAATSGPLPAPSLFAGLLRRIAGASLLGAAMGALAGCGGGGSGTGPASTAVASPATTTALLRVGDVNGTPIEGAVVTVDGGGTPIRARTGAEGVATLVGVPTGDVSITIVAPAFETLRFTSRLPGGVTAVTMDATGAWAIGRAIVLGSRMLDRAADGSTLTFAVDVAVVDANSAAIETLTGADFRVRTVDCGWGGPRECASDAGGNASPNGGNFSADGGPEAFRLQPPAGRRPYAVALLAERSAEISDWGARAAALKSFFAAIGGNDAASLATVEARNGASIFAPLGPFTRDGRVYLDAIDRLGAPAGGAPELTPGLEQAIQLAAAARNSVTSGAQPMVIALARQGLTVAEFGAVSALARQADVQVGAVGTDSDNYGLTELAARTGGIAVQYSDSRQLGIIFGAMDRVLAGVLPYYRMSFRLQGEPRTFVAGGNVKVWLSVRVPASMPNRGVDAQLDVAIP
jgi:hypothetical protein